MMRFISFIACLLVMPFANVLSAQTPDNPVVKFSGTEVRSGNISTQTVQALANGNITIAPAPPVVLSPKGFKVSFIYGKDVVYFDSENGKVSTAMRDALMHAKPGQVFTLSDMSYNFGGTDHSAPTMTFTIK